MRLHNVFSLIEQVQKILGIPEDSGNFRIFWTQKILGISESSGPDQMRLHNVFSIIEQVQKILVVKPTYSYPCTVIWNWEFHSEKFLKKNHVQLFGLTFIINKKYFRFECLKLARKVIYFPNEILKIRTLWAGCNPFFNLLSLSS